VSDPVLPRIARGDQSAVRECLDRYGGLVWGLARRFLGNLADAEDAVQDVFVDLWKSAGRFDPALASEPTFVTLVARRRLIDGRRRTLRRPPAQPLPEALPAGPPGPDRAETADEAARAAQALAGLRDEQKRMIHLAIYQGLTHEEIAERTGVPLGTVKTHIRRGLMKVREALATVAVEGGGR
jgi:RNA polymerase sigma-70 factor (ECF subfamily)